MIFYQQRHMKRQKRESTRITTMIGLFILFCIFLLLTNFPTEGTGDASPTSNGHGEPPRDNRVLTSSLRPRKKRIVFVIPYRDRRVHLRKFMRNLQDIQRDAWDVKVIVVEQDNRKMFNKGWLMNIGIREAMQRYQPECIVTHDVDMLADTNVDYGWCDRPTQPCSEMDCWNNSVPQNGYNAGGSILATPDHWTQLNGYSNELEGWGGEDDEFKHRLNNNNLFATIESDQIRRPPKGFGRCKCLHDNDHTKRVADATKTQFMLQKLQRLHRGSQEWKRDGLNTLKYNIQKESGGPALHLMVNKV